MTVSPTARRGGADRRRALVGDPALGQRHRCRCNAVFYRQPTPFNRQPTPFNRHPTPFPPATLHERICMQAQCRPVPRPLRPVAHSQWQRTERCAQPGRARPFLSADEASNKYMVAAFLANANHESLSVRHCSLRCASLRFFPKTLPFPSRSPAVSLALTRRFRTRRTSTRPSASTPIARYSATPPTAPPPSQHLSPITRCRPNRKRIGASLPKLWRRVENLGSCQLSVTDGTGRPQASTS